MKICTNLIMMVALATIFTSCAKEGSPDLQAKIKNDPKPQVMDVLKGKPKAEILKMKYQLLKATCALNTVKTTKGSFYADSSGITPLPPVAPENPISNPSENILVYDLKLQQLVDSELTKDVKSKLSVTKDGRNLDVDITIKAVTFQDSLNIANNQKRYFMKHTPVLSYLAEYRLSHADQAVIVGSSEGKIYEKIEGQKNTMISIEIDPDRYNFALECSLERTINASNPAHAAEFENQWVEVDCQAPKNEAEKTLCK